MQAKSRNKSALKQQRTMRPRFLLQVELLFWPERSPWLAQRWWWNSSETTAKSSTASPRNSRRWLLCLCCTEQ